MTLPLVHTVWWCCVWLWVTLHSVKQNAALKQGRFDLETKVIILSKVDIFLVSFFFHEIPCTPCRYLVESQYQVYRPILTQKWFRPNFAAAFVFGFAVNLSKSFLKLFLSNAAWHIKKIASIALSIPLSKDNYISDDELGHMLSPLPDFKALARDIQNRRGGCKGCHGERDKTSLVGQ